MMKVHLIWICLMIIIHLPQSFVSARDIVFKDDFDGQAGETPDPGKWECTLDQGSVALDGKGCLVMTGVEMWNAAVLTSKYAIPGKGEDVSAVMAGAEGGPFSILFIFDLGEEFGIRGKEHPNRPRDLGRDRHLADIDTQRRRRLAQDAGEKR